MSNQSTIHFKIQITTADGERFLVDLNELMALDLDSNAQMVLVDAQTGAPLTHLKLHFDGEHYLVLEDELIVASSESAVPVIDVTAISPPTSDLLIPLGAIAAAGGAALAAGSGSSDSEDRIPASFSVNEVVDGATVERLLLSMGDELLLDLGESDQIAAATLNNESMLESTFSYLQNSAEGQDHSYESLSIDTYQVTITNTGLDSLIFRLYETEDYIPDVQGTLIINSDTDAEVEFRADEGATNLFPELQSVSVVADLDADLAFSNNGADDFMPALTSINVNAGAEEAELSISASFNDYLAEGESLPTTYGSNFMRSLETISVVSAGNEATMSLSVSGGDNFMSSLQSIYIEANGESGSADVSISASLGQISFPDYNDSIITNPGSNFMPSLETITIVSTSYNASLSISHSGAENFMQSLESIMMTAGNDIDLSVSASINNYHPDDSDVVNGSGFMNSLETITLRANDAEAGSVSFSLSHSGSDYFMPSLTSIELHGNTGAELSVSASANYNYYENSNTNTIDYRDLHTGEHFMQSLESITIINASESDASLSISHSGGDYFMQSLREIVVENSGTESAEISISASANFWHYAQSEYDNELDEAVIVHTREEALELKGDNFMTSLKSIKLSSVNEQASLSISHSGGINFMTSLETITVTGASAIISMSFSAGRDIVVDADDYANVDTDLYVDQLPENILPQLQSIVFDATEGFAELSISHEGSSHFLPLLSDITFTGGTGADLELETEVNLDNNPASNPTHFMSGLTDAHVVAEQAAATVQINTEIEDVIEMYGHTTYHENFMTALSNVSATSADYLAYVTIAANTSDTASLNSLSTVTVSGHYGFVDLVNHALPSITIDFQAVTGAEDSIAWLQLQNATTASTSDTFTINFGSSNFQYNSIYETVSSELNIYSDNYRFLDTNLIFKDEHYSEDVWAEYTIVPQVNVSQSINGLYDSVTGEYTEIYYYNDQVIDVIGGDFSGFIGYKSGHEGSTLASEQSGWVNLGNNNSSDRFVFNSADIGNGVIAGFDDGLDIIDFSLLGSLFNGTINDHTQADTHVSTAAGEILITLASDDATNTVLWLNTEGESTVSFDDFESYFYIVDGASITIDSNDILFAT